MSFLVIGARGSVVLRVGPRSVDREDVDAPMVSNPHGWNGTWLVHNSPKIRGIRYTRVDGTMPPVDVPFPWYATDTRVVQVVGGFVCTYMIRLGHYVMTVREGGRSASCWLPVPSDSCVEPISMSLVLVRIDASRTVLYGLVLCGGDANLALRVPQNPDDGAPRSSATAHVRVGNMPGMYIEAAREGSHVIIREDTTGHGSECPTEFLFWEGTSPVMSVGGAVAVLRGVSGNVDLLHNIHSDEIHTVPWADISSRYVVGSSHTF